MQNPILGVLGGPLDPRTKLRKILNVGNLTLPLANQNQTLNEGKP
jgi:hypothetical protein